MAAYTSWTSPVNHPFLSKPFLKRKLSYYSGDSSSEPSPTSAASDLPSFSSYIPKTSFTADDLQYQPETSQAAHDAKRRRFDSLENDFEHLTLAKLREQEKVQEQLREKLDRIWELHGEVEMEDVLLPSSIESPPIPPIDSSPGWFEPEKDRIVVTSLDSDSDLDVSPHTMITTEPDDVNDQLVSKFIVDTLKSPQQTSSESIPAASLFNIKRWGDLTPLERITAGMVVGPAMVSAMPSDDAMDVE